MLLELRRLHVDPDAVGGEKIGRSPTERFRALHAITDASHQGGRASAGHASGVAGAAGPRHSPRAGRLWRRWQPAARRARHRDARQLLQARRHPGAGRHPGALLQRGPRRPQRGRRQRRLVDAATVTLSKPGVYRFYCTFHGTSDGQGMAGTIVVGDVRYETSESTTGRDLPVVRHAISVTADGVAVENLTVRNAVANGLFWTGVTGYRASYVTASANGDYGIYAFGSRDGVFEQSYASGSPDAGFYIGQCNPCDAVIDGVVSEGNALGYSGTNASDLDIVRSVFRHNWAGIVPNTGDYELLPPFRDVRIVGNLVQDNGNRAAPGAHVEWSGFGNGIVLAGGNDSLVQRNRVLDHPNHGILVTPNLDEHFWTSAGNQVRDNVIAGSGRADLALAGPAGAGNCFAGNTVRSTVPVGLQAFQSCDGPRLPLRMDLSTTLQSLA